MQDNNIKYFLIIFVVLCFIYSFFFVIRRAHFICNENECKIQYLNTFGNILRTTDVNWNEYKSFDTGLIVGSDILRKQNSPLRKKIYWTVIARLQDDSEINFFGLASRDEYKTRNVVRILNQQLMQSNTPNIDIIYRYR